MTQRYHLDRKLISEQMKGKGWGQLTLAVEAELGLRVISDILSTVPYVCSRKTAMKVADALGVDVDEIACGWLSDWQSVPDLCDRSLANKLRRAVRLDMCGEHIRAAQDCASVLEQISHDAEPEAYPLVVVRYVAFLDHCGEHEVALELIDELIANARPGDSPLARQWARYHRGIALRRLERFDHSRRAFEELLAEKGPFRVSARHQLGVVDIEEAKGQSGEECERLLGRAAEHLQAALHAWSAFGRTYRKGLALQRLGEVARMREDYDLAYQLYTDALVTYAWEHCDRYVMGARADLEELRGLGPKPAPVRRVRVPADRRSEPAYA